MLIYPQCNSKAPNSDLSYMDFSGVDPDLHQREIQIRSIDVSVVAWGIRP